MEKPQFTLEAFQGPLDLLLHLISKNQLDIYNIPIVLLLEQYMAYLEAMAEMDMEITGEFTAMTAQLLLIKSRSLLPVYEDAPEEDEPMRELIRDLAAYRSYKEAAGMLGINYVENAGVIVKLPELLKYGSVHTMVYDSGELLQAYEALLARARRKLPPPAESFAGIVGREPAPVWRYAVTVLRQIMRDGSAGLWSLLSGLRGRSEIIAMFLAVLELARSGRIGIAENGDNPADGDKASIGPEIFLIRRRDHSNDRRPAVKYRSAD